jgi:hypothetical protein
LKSIDNPFGGPPQPEPPAAHPTVMSRVFLDMQVTGELGVRPSIFVRMIDAFVEAARRKRGS